jgi:hypothetical protein
MYACALYIHMDVHVYIFMNVSVRAFLCLVLHLQSRLLRCRHLQSRLQSTSMFQPHSAAIICKRLMHMSTKTHRDLDASQLHAWKQHLL